MADSKRMNVTRRSFLLGGSAVLAGSSLALAGCNKRKGGDNSVGSAQITAGVAYADTQISPIANYNALGRTVLWHICEGLYNIDFHTFKTYNGLAALSPTKVNDYTYDVVLRDDAKFSNGDPVTPDDVVTSFKANMTDETFSALLGFIKDINPKDSKTVTFTLNYPFENLIEQRLATVFIYPANMAEKELKSKPIGTGPWMLKNFDGNNGGKVEFVPNPNYSGKFPATSESMVWNVLLDNTSRTTAITDRTSLAIEAVPELNAGQISSSGATVEFAQGFSSALLIFNCLKEPFNDVRVRQACHYAINYASLVDVQLDGHATPATSWLPKNHPNYHRASTVYDHNVEKAKQLLKESGHENIDCTLTVNPNWVRNLAPQIQNDLKEVGINVTLDVKTIPWNELGVTNNVLPYDIILNAGDPTQIGDDVDLCMSIWYGDNVWMNGRTCWKKADPVKWNDLNTLMQRAREVSSSSTQQSLWNQCFDIIMENCPMIPMFHREIGSAFLSDKLSNFRPISTAGIVFLGASAQD